MVKFNFKNYIRGLFYWIIFIKINEVNNYILEVEKIWPFRYYYWSEEYALEYLYRNNYYVNFTIDSIKNNEEIFQTFLKSKSF